MSEFIRNRANHLVPVALVSMALFYLVLAASWFGESEATPMYHDMSSPVLALASAIGLIVFMRSKNLSVYGIVGMLMVVSLSVRVVYIIQITSKDLVGSSKWIGVSRSAFLVVCSLLISRMWNTDVRRWMEEGT